MEQTSRFPETLWWKTAPSTAPHASLEGRVSVDVAIVGAGFTGLRAALHLAEAGTSVAVLDAGDVGWGASGRNGGQVNPLLPFNSPETLRTHLGTDYFERLTEASLNSADELFSLIKTYQIDCQARQNGWLRVNHNDRALRKAEKDLKAWNDFGAGMSLIDGEEVRRIAGTDFYRSGVVAPRGGAVQPLMLAQGIADAAKQRGASIFGQSPVLSLEQHEGKWTLNTKNGVVTADWIVIATNGYTDSLLPGLATSIIPVTSIQIATDPLPEPIANTVLTQGHTISDSRRVIMYARREPDNRLVYGGLGKTERDGAITGYDWLVRDAERIFPQLAGTKWSSRWGGRIALTDDHLPHLHEPKKGVLVGLGYNGRGVAMSNVMGRVMAQRILGADPAALPFPAIPIQTVPFRRTKVLGMGTAVWFMRLLDYLETR